MNPGRAEVMRRAPLTAVRRVVFAVLFTLVASAAAYAQQTQPYRDPSGRFTFQYPKKDWQALPGALSALVTISGNKGKASVQVEYFSLADTVKVGEMYKEIVQNESEFIRERQPGADQIRGQAMRPDLKDIVVIDYTRPGMSGVDRVRHYSIVSGMNMYRVSCVAPVADFPKLEAAFEQIAKSFVITAANRTSN
jgi:hypothetical protein